VSGLDKLVFYGQNKSESDFSRLDPDASPPWELLSAMLLMEAAFDVAGLVAAPVVYAWLKAEVRERGMI
jgi:hypothetical protein